MKFLYILLVLVPIAIAMEIWDIGDHTTMFIVSALALVPLAAILGSATEEVAVHTGPKIGGLLNATLGNAAELIITIVALREGLVTVVKASIAGSIIGNVLLVLGAAVLITIMISIDGRSNWLEGAQLIALYVIIGVAFYFVP